METDALEKQIKKALDEMYEKITIGLNKSVKEFLVGLASTTPFDTGYHANNWQMSEGNDDSTVGTYSKKIRRSLQEVISNTEQRFKEITGEEKEPSLFIFNNAKMIEDLEEGNPTAGTGRHANPGFVEAQKNIFLDKMGTIMEQVKF